MPSDCRSRGTRPPGTRRSGRAGRPSRGTGAARCRAGRTGGPCCSSAATTCLARSRRSGGAKARSPWSRTAPTGGPSRRTSPARTASSWSCMTSRPRDGRPGAPDPTPAGRVGAISTAPEGTDVDVSLRAIFRGRRGRLLGALLFTEFGAAVHSIAYSSVLPLASAELDGSALYGAVLTAGAFTTILVLAIGPDRFAGIGPVWTLAVGTVLFLAGVALAVTAQDMVWILVGMVLRGLAGGLLVGLGLTAIGALFEDALRARVMGLFAVMWLLPSLAGPALNAAVAVAAGWRAAMAWPAVVVLVGRLLVGRDAAIIPWRRSTVERPDVGNAVALLLGLVLAASAPAARSGWGVPMLVAGLAAATVASLRVLRVQVSGQRSRFV